MTTKQKKMLGRIITTFIVYVGAIVAKEMGLLDGFSSTLPELLLFLVPYLMIGWDIVYKAFRHIIHGQVFDENFLMSLATFGAFGVGQYSEAVAVMLFYQVGEWFQDYAVTRSRKSITD
ncbi:MAG: heavy metal translocating P-type ATPase, partial [Clostridium sp.]